MIRARREKGFTLIEVIVVMAIISILAGIMIPMVYRVWESNDEELTRTRMRDLKIALVGDRRIVQNGVRTHFGYTGDLGQLPASLTDLITDPGVANWNGPYLPAGFDTTTFDKDAWDRVIAYGTTTDASGRRIAAALTSYGADGAAATADDIGDPDVQVSLLEVTPVSSLLGNISMTFQTAPQAPRSLYLGVLARYRNGSGVAVTRTCCDSAVKVITGSAGNAQVNYTQDFSCAPPEALPVGFVFVSPGVFSDSSCTVSLGGTPLELAVSASGGTLFVNLQIQSVSP
ncbi:MAG: type II secretion system protein [Nitrospirota bacterium]